MFTLSYYSYRQLLKTDSKTKKVKNEILKKMHITCSYRTKYVR